MSGIRIYSYLGHKLFEKLQRLSVKHYLTLMNVGKGVKIKKGLRVTKPHNVVIGNNVSINVDAVLQAHDSIFIGDFTMIAARCIIVTANHDIAKRGLEAFKTTKTAPVSIGRHCWLGAGVTVLPGVTIGDGAVVAAGSIVTRDLPPEMICVGSPAKAVKPRPKGDM